MRLALMGDIHANLSALEAVLNAANKERIDYYLITGDFLGYYYEPRSVIDRVIKLSGLSIAGNHDIMFLNARAQTKRQLELIKSYQKKYGSSLEIALSELGSSHINFLASLKKVERVCLDGLSFEIAHGSPWDADAYVYPDSDKAIWERLNSSMSDYVILGHTHYQFSKNLSDTVVINPGSVGQPRDRKPGAAWTIFDTNTKIVEHRREAYEIAPLCVEAKRRDGYLPYLHTVLNRT